MKIKAASHGLSLSDFIDQGSIFVILKKSSFFGVSNYSNSFRLVIGLIVFLTFVSACKSKPNGEGKRSPRSGYQSEYDADGYNKDGYDIFGYDRNGYNRNGYNANGFDRNGFNAAGRDVNGRDRDGYDQDGYDAQGRDRDGYDQNGFNVHGRNRDGYNQAGFDPNQFTRNLRHPLDLEIQRNRVPNAATFIRLSAFAGLPNAKLKRLMTEVCHRNLDYFFRLGPSFQEVLHLLNRNGGTGDVNFIQFSIELKRKAVETHLIQTGAQFAQLMGEVFQNGFDEEEYLIHNSILISDLLLNFAALPQMRLADLNDLKAFATHVELAEEGARAPLIAGLDQVIQAKRAANQDQVVPRLRARVLAKYNEVQPNLNGDLKYYLLRDPQTWEVNFGDADAGNECMACMDDFDAQNRGIALRTRDGHLVEGENAICRGCLIHHIRAKIGENQFPVRCPTQGHHHELPISAGFLRQGGFNEDEIRLWEVNTLRAYYRVLNGGVDENHLCPTPNCINAIFQQDAVHIDDAENHHVRCPNCEIEHCYRCQDAGMTQVHPGRTCAQMLQPDWNDPRNREIRPCPYCQAPFAKAGGCNAVRCQRCRAMFHYNNGALRWEDTRKYRPIFYHDFSGVVDRRYRLPGEEGYVPGGESAFEGNYPPLTQDEARQQH